MTHSESLDQIAPAMAKAQAAMKAAVMDGENPHFKSRFCTLSSIMDAVRKPLADHGLSVVQGPSAGEGTARVMTMILHASGQWVASELALPVGERATPQAIGSAISYGRRYALAGLLGVVSDTDDDGNAAEESAKASPVAAVRKTATPAPTQTDDGDDFEWKGTISKTEVKEGLNARGAWKVHRVFLGDRTASTFDSKIGDAAEALRKLEAPVVLRVKPGKKPGSYELLGVEEDLPL
jgi:ERF superfamily